MEFAEALEAELRRHFFQMFRYVELLRTFGQTFSAVHAGGDRSSALYRGHGDCVVEFRTLFVPVEQVVVVDVGEDVADRDVVRAWDALW